MNAPQTPGAAQRAAVFVMLLGDEDAARLLERLEPQELEKIGTAMCGLGDVEPALAAEAIAAFITEAEAETLPAGEGEQRFEAMLARAVGESKAENLMQRIAPEARPKSVEIARWLAPAVLARLVAEEHPQVIAVLLLMLEPRPAAQVLSTLPQGLQPQVVERIARLGQVSRQAVEMLDRLLSARIARRYGAGAMALGGAREAANLINLAERQVSDGVMRAITERDAPLAAAIEAEMFTFEMLCDLDPMNMGRLLRDVENNDLVTALKGLREEQQAPFFAAMSSRAADGVRDEMEMLSRTKREDVLAAQGRIVELARKLRDAGEIVLGESDGEYI